MKMKKKAKFGFILIVVMLFLIPTTNTTSAKVSKFWDKYLDEKYDEMFIAPSDDGNFAGLTLFCSLEMDGNGFLRHRWIGNWAILTMKSSDPNFNTSVNITYAVHDPETDLWGGVTETFMIKGSQQIQYITNTYDHYWPPYFYKQGKFFNKWHDRSYRNEWGIGKFNFSYLGHIYIPEFPIPFENALKYLKNFTFLNIPVGEWLYNILLEIFPDQYFPGLELPWPGYLRITS
jgi:hypothetical protein